MHYRAKRRFKRAKIQAEEGTTLKRIAKRRRLESAFLSSSVSADSLPVARSGWQGKRGETDKTPYTKDWLVEEKGFTHFP
jgi:hypothetical protein